MKTKTCKRRRKMEKRERKRGGSMVMVRKMDKEGWKTREKRRWKGRNGRKYLKWKQIKVKKRTKEMEGTEK